MTNTGATTIVSGDVGISPGAGAVGANHPGLTAAMVVGTIHDKDVPAADAQFDKNAAYTQLDLLNGCTVTYPGAFKELAGNLPNIGNLTITPDLLAPLLAKFALPAPILQPDREEAP